MEESRSLKVTLKTEIGASASYKGLGLSTSVSMSIEAGITFSSARRIRAVEGLQAKHFPYKLSDNWKGVTYIQTYNKTTGSYGYLTPSYYDQWFGSYPYGFDLDNQNIGFKAVRKIVKVCDNYHAENDPHLSASGKFEAYELLEN